MSRFATDKRAVEDLALFGGPPAFAEPLHVGRPNLGDRRAFLARVEDLLDRRWFTNNGPFVQEFERRLAERTGTRHCIAVCNATIGLELAIRALGMTGEVIVPSFTFVATAHALEWQGVTPVFCDVDPRTHNLDPDRVEALVTPRTTGIIGVHVWGRPCAVDRLTDIARARGLKLLFDAAHAFACTHRGQPLGRFGDAEVFSFHATKFLNSFEGGAITTQDDELAARLRLMKNFGFAGYDRVVHPGTNGKMTEVCAAMGLSSLERLDELVAVNRDRHRAYAESLRGVPGLSVLAYDPAEASNFQYVVVEVDPERAGLDRDQLVRLLHAENVLARRYFFPGCHAMEPYRSRDPGAGARLPHTERLAARVLTLPNGTSVEPGDVGTVASLLRYLVANAAAIRARLAEPVARGAAPR
jgi:dTDP-4-amino-4,6-dideoxygalactose transaminase